ncbi:hypothetical protein [Burkholderia cenocepacia]|uniref:hypothetical protein n=1 Tax=Burkholderia cenocepacia TaxID=95486 RepID=UPI001F4A2B65|nr:hypothetical protein [Burkholderia cenocepacia]
MKRFTDAVRNAVAQENWYSALAIALTLPDLCAKLETPNEGSRVRYVRWYGEWVEAKYTFHAGLERTRHVFLTGLDCYALRCSYLHEGGGDIQNQRAREALERFHFISPPRHGRPIHCNQFGGILQLQVDKFAIDIADSVDAWALNVSGNADVQERITSLLVIHNGDDGVRF